MSEADVWALCEHTFGRIEARWKTALLAMERDYPLDELRVAFDEAKNRKAGDIRYVVGILTNKRQQRIQRLDEATDMIDWDAEAERWKHLPHVHVLGGRDGPFDFKTGAHR